MMVMIDGDDGGDDDDGGMMVITLRLSERSNATQKQHLIRLR